MSALIDTVAWVRVENGRILCARSRGKELFYIPGGKREPGESDLETLLREVKEELAVAIVTASVAHVGTYEAQAHGETDGVTVRMSCYTAEYEGELVASSEIEEILWLSYADRDRVPPVDQVFFDDLRASGELD
jgi:8-oxo-dGTP diphosphatase